MPKLTDENIARVAFKVAGELFASTVVFTNKWIKELDAISNIQFSNALYHNIIFEPLFFGIYYTNARFNDDFPLQKNMNLIGNS